MYGCTAMFFEKKERGDYFSDKLFAYLADEAFSRKGLLLKERIHS